MAGTSYPDIGAIQSGGAPDIGAFEALATYSGTAAASAAITGTPRVKVSATPAASAAVATHFVGLNLGTLAVAAAAAILASAAVETSNSATMAAGAACGAHVTVQATENVAMAASAPVIAHGTLLRFVTMAAGASCAAHVTVTLHVTIAAGAAMTGKRAATPVLLGTISSPPGWYIPTLSGGVDVFQIFVGGYDRSRWAHRGTANVQSQTLGRRSGGIQFQNVPSGDLRFLDTDLEWVPVRGQVVLLKEKGRTLFRGCIREINASRPLSTNFVLYDCIFADKATLCDHRVVTRSYPAVQDGGEVWDVADVVKDVLSKFLNGEGITLDPSFPTTLGELTVTTSAYVPVTQLFDLVTNLTGLEWFIDLSQVLRFVDPTEGDDAPFEITETSRNWRNLTAKVTDVDYRNRQYVVSNRKIFPAGTSAPSVTESYTLEDYGVGSVVIPDHTGYQVEAVSRGMAVGYIWLQFGIGSIVSITRNGIPEDFFNYSEVTDTLTGSGDQWWGYFTGAAFIAPHLYCDPGDVVVIEYVPYSSVAAVESGDVLALEESEDPAPGESFGTCGSGRYDAVEQVNDVDTQEGLDAIATALKTRLGVIPTSVTFQTDFPGLEVGQLLHADIPRNMLADIDLFVTGVSWREESSGMDLGQESSGRWTIEATNFPGIGNWKKVWERLYRRTQHPQPLERIQPISLILAGGGAIRAGMEIAPGKISEPGYLKKITARFGTAPAGQDLVIDIFLNGVSMLAPSKLIIADGEGESADVILTEFAKSTIFAAKGDTLTASVTYQNVGGSPVNARSGIVVMAWSV